MAVNPKHIVIVKPLVFDANDYERFDIEYMLDQGIRITVVDVADIVIPESPRGREAYADWPSIEFKIVTRRGELAPVFASIADADLVVNFVSDRLISARSFFVLRAMGRMKAPSLIISSEAYPGFVESERASLTLFSQIRNLPGRISRANILNSLLARIPRQVLGVPAADFLVQGGRRSMIKSALVGPSTKTIQAHSLDLDRIMRLQKAMPSASETDTAVFIDQGVIGHREYLHPAMRGNFEGARYFKSLRVLFDRIEAETDLKVIIAAHPHSTLPYDQGEFGDREIVRHRSIELVIGSRMVIAHNSALIGAAVALNKPILIVTSREDMYRRGDESAGYHLGFIQALNKKLCFLDELENLGIDAATRVDPEVYHQYVVNYIKQDSSPDLSYWEIVLQEVAAHTSAKRRVTSGTSGVRVDRI
jgi:hypothetical protein